MSNSLTERETSRETESVADTLESTAQRPSLEPHSGELDRRELLIKVRAQRAPPEDRGSNRSLQREGGNTGLGGTTSTLVIFFTITSITFPGDPHTERKRKKDRHPNKKRKLSWGEAPRVWQPERRANSRHRGSEGRGAEARQEIRNAKPTGGHPLTSGRRGATHTSTRHALRVDGQYLHAANGSQRFASPDLTDDKTIKALVHF